MRTTDPSRMSRTERLAELGQVLAAAFQRFAANAIKPASAARKSQDHLDDVAVGEASCRSTMESR